LRWQGIACRHGRPGDPADDQRLFGDCDVVANFALASGRPRDAREANRRLVEAAARGSKPGARLIFFSTLAVYPTFQPAGEPVAQTAYGREKLRGETAALRAGRAAGKQTWVLRLGHVYGELQGIRGQVVEVVTQPTIAVARDGLGASNVVHTATIVDAILTAARGDSTPGVYDLVSTPCWTWRQLLEQEAAALGRTPQLVAIEPDPMIAGRSGMIAKARLALRRMASRILATPRTREIGLSVSAWLSPSLNLRLQSANFRRRAVSEIAALRARPASLGAFTIPGVVPREMPGLTPTIALLNEGRGRVPTVATTTFAGDAP
jgi:nucleoside-diphosphate-sugar epimerase